MKSRAAEWQREANNGKQTGDNEMTEFCIVNDEGVLEDGFYTLAEAEQIAATKYSGDGVEVDERRHYDEDGQFIEE